MFSQEFSMCFPDALAAASCQNHFYTSDITSHPSFDGNSSRSKHDPRKSDQQENLPARLLLGS
jgi:hypothetical protein